MSENKTKNPLIITENFKTTFKKYIIVPFGVTVGLFLLICSIQGIASPIKPESKSILSQIEVNKKDVELCETLKKHAKNKIADVLNGIPPKDYKGPEDMARWQTRVETPCTFQ